MAASGLPRVGEGHNRVAVELPESASVLLDAVRFGAALMVVAGHVTFPSIGLGYTDRRFLGDAAVPLFFVVSGFVIRYVTRTRERTAREYFIDRASRIYSVVLPAMVWTLVAGAICYALDPARFVWIFGPRFTHPVQRLVLNLTFLSQAWGRSTIPFNNAPFWTLGYECIFYLLYGFSFYLRGAKRVVWWMLTAVAIGPQVMFLFPIWWLGCGVYELYVRRTKWLTWLVVTLGGLWLAAGLGLLAMGWVWLLRAPMTLVRWVAGWPEPLGLMGLSHTRANMFAVAVAVVGAVMLFPLLLAMDFVRISGNGRWVRGLRFVADGTFTVYLMHFPFLLVLAYAHVLRAGHLWGNVAVVAVMCLVLVGVAVPVDGFKRWLRRWLRRKLPAVQASLLSVERAVVESAGATGGRDEAGDGIDGTG